MTEDQVNYSININAKQVEHRHLQKSETITDYNLTSCNTRGFNMENLKTGVDKSDEKLNTQEEQEFSEFLKKDKTHIKQAKTMDNAE